MRDFFCIEMKDEAGPNIRAYSIEVDPARPNREVLTAITGVYTSRIVGKPGKGSMTFPRENSVLPISMRRNGHCLWICRNIPGQSIFKCLLASPQNSR